MSTLVFILVLSALVIIHELGHYLAAKWAGVVVEEFGLGYPPKAKKLFTYKGTDFTLNWIPFGGFVRMLGEEDVVAGNSETKSAHSLRSSGQFTSATTWQKLVIILAGATVNFIFGILAFAIVFSVQGIPQPITQPRIAEIAVGSPAEQAGLPTNVAITGFETEPGERLTVSSVAEVINFVDSARGQTVTVLTTGLCENLECSQEEQKFSVYLRTIEETPANQGSIGVVFTSVIFTKYPWYEMPFRSAWYGLQQAIFMGGQIVQAFGSLLYDAAIGGGFPEDIAGPVGIVHQAQKSGIFSEGALTILSFAGMLSVNLAVMNILPIPPLDGGRAVFILLQSVVAKKYTLTVEYVSNYVGYVFLLGLIIAITIKDVWSLFA